MEDRDKLLKIMRAWSRKEGKCRRMMPQQWVLGGLCRQTNACILLYTKGWSASTIMAANSDHVEMGSVILRLLETTTTKSCLGEKATLLIHSYGRWPYHVACG